METYRTETKMARDGELHLSKLPFRAGEEVEVIVLSREPALKGEAKYALRGEPIRYDRPTEPVSEDDWEALQ